MNINLIGHGFIPPEEITDDQYVFGDQRSPDNIIQDNGDWRPYLPKEEHQRSKYFETYGCTIYNSITPIEILERKLFNEQSEYAERPVYIRTGTRPPGNNPHVIAEDIRKNGLAPENLLPFTNELKTLEEYASPNPLPIDIMWACKEWLNKKSFNHTWAFNSGDPKTKQDILKEAIRRSPIGVSVVAWKEINGIYYKEDGEQDNHWTTLCAYEDDFPIIFDSYPPYIKKLSKYYDFGFSKQYTISKKQLTFKELCEKQTSYQLFLSKLRNYLQDIIR